MQATGTLIYMQNKDCFLPLTSVASVKSGKLHQLRVVRCSENAVKYKEVTEKGESEYHSGTGRILLLLDPVDPLGY